MSWWWVLPCLLVIASLPIVWRPLWNLAGTMSLPTAASGVPIAPAAPSQLGFSASHEGSDWRLVWSRDALSHLNAVGAMLTIRDGGVDRLQFLSPQDLAAGAIFYVPRSNDLTFNLKVARAAGPDVEEQIRVLGATGDSVPQRAETVPPRRVGDASRVTPAPEGAVEAARLRQFQPPERPAAGAAPAVEPLPDAKLPAAAAPQIQQAALSAPQPPRPAPEATKAAPVSAPPQPTSQPAAAPAKPIAEPPKVAAPVTSPQQMAEPPRPALHPITRIDPSPVRSVPAAWPRNVARQSAMEVRIVVQIDDRGRVVGAAPIQRTVANFQFVDVALAAARMWTFSPALENGKPVRSETVLTFKFTP